MLQEAERQVRTLSNSLCRLQSQNRCKALNRLGGDCPGMCVCVCARECVCVADVFGELMCLRVVVCRRGRDSLQRALREHVFRGCGL